MRKFFSLIAAVLFAGSMMADNFVPVTDASTLADGDQIIITDVNAAAAISTLQKSNNRGVTTVALTDGVIVVFPGANVQIITLVAAEANFMLQVGEDAYLYAASNSSNHLKTANAETVGDNGKFAISITEGVASVIAQGTNSRNDLRYNSGSSCFSCYGSSTSIEAGLKIFKKEGGVTPPEPVEEYYLVGSMNEWAVSADYKLTRNTAAEGNEYKIDITLTEGNQEMKVKGVLEGRAEDAWYPGGTNNNFTINDAGDYTIYFRPNADGGDGWHEGYIFAEYHAPAVAITCLDIYQMAKDDVVDLLNDVVVTYANGKNVWVRDETASMLLYLSANTTWKAGDVLSDVAGVVDVYNGIHEVKPSAAQVAAVTATAGEVPAAEAVATVAASDVNKYIVMPEIEFEEDAAFAEGSQSNIVMNGVTVRNQFKNGFAFEAGRKYNIYGVVTIYQNNPQVYFITAEKIIGTAIDNTNIDAKVIKTIENGQLIIIKNGVRYNAQGAVVR